MLNSLCSEGVNESHFIQYVYKSINIYLMNLLKTSTFTHLCTSIQLCCKSTVYSHKELCNWISPKHSLEATSFVVHYGLKSPITDSQPHKPTWAWKKFVFYFSCCSPNRCLIFASKYMLK